MAKQPTIGNLNTRSRVQFDFLDGGRHDFEYFSDLTEEQGDGTLSSVRTTRAEEGADGEAFVPIPRPQDPLVVCHECRNTRQSLFRRQMPSHGLLRKRNARQCPCGQYLCGRHVVMGSDGVWRCRSCARRATLWGFVMAIFFKRGR